MYVKSLALICTSDSVYLLRPLSMKEDIVRRSALFLKVYETTGMVILQQMQMGSPGPPADLNGLCFG
jgi:hypothetical protein